MKKIAFYFFIFATLFASANTIVGNIYNNIPLKNEVLKSNIKGNNSLNSNKLYENFNLKAEYLCPVKGVKISENKNFLGFIEYKSGKIIAISSPKYTFSYYNEEIKKDENSISNIYVTDFYSKKIIDAKKAFYVFGSSIMSVGGDDIIPFFDEKSANDFSLKNNGKKIYRFDRMDDRFIQYLDMR